MGALRRGQGASWRSSVGSSVGPGLEGDCVDRSTAQADRPLRFAPRSGTLLLAAAGLILLTAASLPAAHAQGAGDPEPSAAAPPPSTVDLDRLLRLPSSYSESSAPRHGGSAAEDWLERFREARANLDNSRVALAKAQRELESTASESGQWAVSAPGASDPQNSPVSYRLRQEIRTQRENVEKNERSLRTLEVEADLKEVPLDWRD
jgi:hypothetical protein